MNSLGVVEGFYWMERDKVGNRFREFSVSGRIRLFETMAHINEHFATGINTYLYDPKMCRKRNNQGSVEEMLGGALEKTIEAACKNGIRFIYGIAPGATSQWNHCCLHERAEYLRTQGAELALLFDDSEGCRNVQQMLQQAQLANELASRWGLFGICPPSYSGDLQNKIKVLYEALDTEIPIIHVGRKGWNRSMDHTHIFPFHGQPNIIWDNWMAADSSEPKRLEFNPPLRRSRAFIEGIETYLLNLCFPEERIVHMVASLAFLRDGDMDSTVEIMSHATSFFLDVPLDTARKYIYCRVLNADMELTSEDRDQFQAWPSLTPFL